MIIANDQIKVAKLEQESNERKVKTDADIKRLKSALQQVPFHFVAAPLWWVGVMSGRHWRVGIMSWRVVLLGAWRWTSRPVSVVQAGKKQEDAEAETKLAKQQSSDDQRRVQVGQH